MARARAGQSGEEQSPLDQSGTDKAACGEQEEEAEWSGLRAAKEKAERVIQESKALRRQAPKKVPQKRSILKEIGNLRKEEADGTLAKKEKKSNAKGKAPALIKGQTKMTAFFVKSS